MNVFREILVLPIRLYQLVGSPLKSALLGSAGRCRFQPTCSTFAIQAIRRHGCLYGSWLALCRICRCHPWGGCGYDPVPGEPSSERAPQDSSSESPRSYPMENARAIALAFSFTLPLI